MVFPEGVEGCSVLDLGSGAGLDCFVLSRLVGETGRVVGVDMTKEQVPPTLLTHTHTHTDSLHHTTPKHTSLCMCAATGIFFILTVARILSQKYALMLILT